jgi:hypothetical protein
VQGQYVFGVALFANTISVPGYTGTVVQIVESTDTIKDKNGKPLKGGIFMDTLIEGFALDKGANPGLDAHFAGFALDTKQDQFIYEYEVKAKIGVGLYDKGGVPKGSSYKLFSNKKADIAKVDYGKNKVTSWTYKVVLDATGKSPLIKVTSSLL